MTTWNDSLILNNLEASIQNQIATGLTNPLNADVIGNGKFIAGCDAPPFGTSAIICRGTGTFLIEDTLNNPLLLVSNTGLVLGGTIPNTVTVRAPTVSPSTDSSTLIATTAFVQSAISAGTGNAGTINITDTNANATYYPTFVSSDGTSQTVNIDKTTTPLTYNPATATLTATTFNGALVGNADTSTTTTNIAGGTGGSVPYQSASGTTALLANGTVGQVLTSSGTTLAPIWTTPSAPSAGTITATGGDSVVDFNENGVRYRCHIFTTVGAYTLTVSAITQPSLYDFCIVGGGGGGGNGSGTDGGGGGGAGNLICAYNVPLPVADDITGTVGSGGQPLLLSESTTIVLPAPISRTITASGGGRGGTGTPGLNGTSSFSNTGITPFTTTLGSSGGGGSAGNGGGSNTGSTNAFPLSQISNLLFGGGRAGGGSTVGVRGGGGGGYNGVGSAGGGSNTGAGGNGYASVFSGTLRPLACGGGGGGSDIVGTAGGLGGTAGGVSGGGDGGAFQGNATAPLQNTGSGGGGGGGTGGLGTAGADGIVMIRYAI